MSKFSPIEAISFGWNTFKTNVGFFLILTLVVGILQGLLPYIVISLTGETTVYVNVGDTSYRKTSQGPLADNVLLSTFLNLIVLVVNLVLSLGLTRVLLDFVDGKKGDLKDLYQQYPLFLKALGTFLLQALIIVAGLLLFIIPGIYLSIKLMFASYVVVDKKAGPIDAIKTSFEITSGNWWRLVFFGIICGVLTLAGLLALVVGLFVAIPVILLAYVYVYRQLAGGQASPAPAPAAPAQPTPAAPVPAAPTQG